MAKTRLNANMRDNLIAHARTVVNERFDKELSKANVNMGAFLERLVLDEMNKIKETEWVVLRKYNCTYKSQTVDLVCETGWVRRYLALPEDVVFEYPNGRDCSKRIVVTEKQAKEFESRQAAIDTIAEAKTKMFRDYESLVRSSRYVEEVYATWKGARKASLLSPGLPMVTNIELKKRIEEYEQDNHA